MKRPGNHLWLVTLSLKLMKSESAELCVRPRRRPQWQQRSCGKHTHFISTALPQVWNSNAVKDEFMGQVVLSGLAKDSSDPQRLQLRKRGRQMADEMPGQIGLRIITSTQLTAIWLDWWTRGRRFRLKSDINKTPAKKKKKSTCFCFFFIAGCEPKILFGEIFRVETWIDWMSAF